MESNLKLTKELLRLVNSQELTSQQVERMKDLICFLSEQKNNKQISSDLLPQLNSILYNASVRMRTFGYNRLNNLSEESENGTVSILHSACVENYYKTNTGFVLDRYQKEVLDCFEDNNQRLFLSAPTSFGKTFLLKEIIYRHSNTYSNIVIVLPTVALLMEVTDDLSSFCHQHSFDYVIINSIYRDVELGNRNIFILTPERVLRLLALHPDISVDFFFYDEIYKIDEDISSKDDDDASDTIEIDIPDKAKYENRTNHRSVAFRLALYYLLKMDCACYIAGPFIQLKPLKSGFKALLERFNITSKQIDFVPTLKTKYRYKGKKLFITSPFDNDVQAIEETSKKDHLKHIVEYLHINNYQQAIIYCLYPGYTENYARDYCNQINKAFPKEETLLFIDHLKKNYSFTYGKRQNSLDDWDFLYSLEHCIGIHNGRYPKYFQREIMNLFNLHQFPILFCTSTIVEGVNTNAKTVILYNNPKGDNEAGKKFLLLNINGRAGRYLRHFVGNIVYLDDKSIKIEESPNISLDFKLFSQEAILSDLDLENTDEEDLCENNKMRKRKISLDKAILPDKVFEQNRLIERRKQEKILKLILSDKYFNRLRNIGEATLFSFMESYFECILEIWAEIGEISFNQINAIKWFSKKYADKGYSGVLKYQFDKYNGTERNKKYVNETYGKTFKNVKDTIEYQIPKILCLFESLINHAFQIKGINLAHPIDFSNVIRYFEIGAKTDIGVDMIEKGIPVITVKKLETINILGDTLEEQRKYLKKRFFYVATKIDAYEKNLLSKYGLFN